MEIRKAKIYSVCMAWWYDDVTICVDDVHSHFIKPCDILRHNTTVYPLPTNPIMWIVKGRRIESCGKRKITHFNVGIYSWIIWLVLVDESIKKSSELQSRPTNSQKYSISALWLSKPKINILRMRRISRVRDISIICMFTFQSLPTTSLPQPALLPRFCTLNAYVLCGKWKPHYINAQTQCVRIPIAFNFGLHIVSVPDQDALGRMTIPRREMLSIPSKAMNQYSGWNLIHQYI